MSHTPALRSIAIPHALLFTLATSLAGATVPQAQEVNLTLTADSVTLENQDVDRLAATAYVVTVTVPAGDAVGFSVELDEDSQADQGLHLIVDDRRYDDIPEGWPGERNVFRTTLTGTGVPFQFLVRVANVEPSADETAQTSFGVTFDIDPAAPCNGSGMVSVISDEVTKMYDEVPGLGAQINPFNGWQEHERTLEAFGGLMPDEAAVRITGLVSDGGTACADPVGHNIMVESELGLISNEELSARVQERMMRMTPQEMMEMSKSMQGDPSTTDPGASAMFQRMTGIPMPMIPASVMADLEGSTMFEVYSPNGASWLTGSLWGQNPDYPIYEHSGQGSWQANSAAHFWIALPGVPPSTLEAGRTYQAILPVLGDSELFYTRWNGQWLTARPRIHNCKWTPSGWVPDGATGDEASEYRDTFEGQIERASASEIRGTVTILELTGSHIEATFDLSGAAELETEEYWFERSEDPAQICEYEGPGNLMRANMEIRHLEPGEVTIRGTLSAPSSVTTTRKGRHIATTASLDAQWPLEVPSEPDVFASTWPTHEWKVLCYETDEATWAGPLIGDPAVTDDYETYHAALEAFQTISGNEAECDDTQPGSAAEVRGILERASAWMDAQGLAPPANAMREGKYLGFLLVDGTLPYCLHGACVQGRAAYMAGNGADESAMILLFADPKDVGHELLHAVQHSYNSFRDADVPAWITEGTAEAVGKSFAEHSAYSDRSFKQRLDLHRTSDGESQAAYNDETFWRGVARELEQGRYAFLGNLFSDGSLASEPVSILDRILHERGLGGLESVLPQVLAGQLNDRRFY